ncbi:hypothetical protein ACOME3_000477 [Neoechinorhynchus agilis]
MRERLMQIDNNLKRLIEERKGVEESDKDDSCSNEDEYDGSDVESDQSSSIEHVTNRVQEVTRPKITKMSDEVVHSNPYSRLMALQKMGIVMDYESVRDLSIAIVGIGGVGASAAEMLTRCGVGKLILFDYDKVEMANMNRMFYQPKHVNMTKVDAASQQLRLINPDVQIEVFDMNISSLDEYPLFVSNLRTRGLKGRVDLVLSCVDNYEARLTINKACNFINMIWMESGVSETGIDGHIQIIIPGFTACFACVPPLVIASGIDERSLKRDGVCAASLPTTMSLIASLLVQNALKFLLQFGTVSTCISYSGATDHFQSMNLKPNPTCNDIYCVDRQKEHKDHVFELNYLPEKKSEEDVIHESNEFGIEIVSGGELVDDGLQAQKRDLRDEDLEKLQNEFNELAIDD